MTIVRRINRCAYFRRLACNGAVLLGQNLVAVRLSIKKNFILNDIIGARLPCSVRRKTGNQRNTLNFASTNQNSILGQ